MSVSRREFFRGGLAAAGVAGLTLRADALPTLPSGTLDPYPLFRVLAGQSELGTAVMQMPARTPTCAAMTAMTLNALSGGRFILGLGPSGPRVVEGWYGVPYGKPMTRTREFIAIVRKRNIPAL